MGDADGLVDLVFAAAGLTSFVLSDDDVPKRPRARRDPLADATLRWAVAKWSEGVLDRGIALLVTPGMTPEDGGRVGKRVQGAIELGYTFLEGKAHSSARRWAKYVDLCAGDPNVAGKIAMTVYAKAGFLPITAFPRFFATWATAARQAKQIPTFMERA